MLSWLWYVLPKSYLKVILISERQFKLMPQGNSEECVTNDSLVFKYVLLFLNLYYWNIIVLQYCVKYVLSSLYYLCYYI